MERSIRIHQVMTGACIGSGMALVWLEHWQIAATLFAIALFAIHIRLVLRDI